MSSPDDEPVAWDPHATKRAKEDFVVEIPGAAAPKTPTHQIASEAAQTPPSPQATNPSGIPQESHLAHSSAENTMSTAEMRRVLKVQDRTIKDQDSAIHRFQLELSKRVAEVRKQGRGIQRKNQEIEALQDEKAAVKAAYEELRAFAQRVISDFESQLKKAIGESTHAREDEDKLRKLELELVQANLEKKNLEQALDQANLGNKTLEQALEKCKNQIFNMQPDDDVADAVVASQYEQLRESVSNWIDSDLEEATGYFENAVVARLEPMHLNQVQRAFLFGDISIATEHPGAESLFAEMTAGQYLWENILSDSVHFLGLDRSMESFLSDIEMASKDLDPRNGANPNALWTPKVYKALLNHPRYSAARLQAIDSHADEIFSVFKKLLGPKQAAKMDPKNCKELVKQAVSLADLIRSSSSGYCFTRPRILRNSSKDSMLFHPKDLVNHEVIDADTLRRIKKIDEAVADGDGYVGHIIAVISQGLKRRGDHEKRSLDLVKPRIMVKFFEPLPRNKKRKIG